MTLKREKKSKVEKETEVGGEGEKELHRGELAVHSHPSQIEAPTLAARIK